MIPFLLTYNNDLYRLTEISFGKYQVELPDGSIRTLRDYRKLPGNDIGRWSFMKNFGDWDDEESAEGLGRLIKNNISN